MLESLDIKNFRGIQSLRLDNLARVNICVGKNAAGKTSVLEAVALAANPLAPGWLATFGMWRELPPPALDQADSITTAFPELSPNRKIELSFTVSGKVNSLSISGITDQSKLSTEQLKEIAKASSSSSSTEPPKLYGIEHTYTPANGKSVTVRMDLLPEGNITRNSKESSVDKLGAFFIHARRSTSSGETATAFTRLLEKKQQNDFLDALRVVDPRVLNIHAGLRGKYPIVLVDIGLPTLIPMNALGDGFCRVCLMLTGIVFGNSKIVIVDEVDSGLHHSVMASFWTWLAKLGQHSPVQFFCSTHSEEMLNAAVEAFSQTPDLLRIIRLDRKDASHVDAIAYSYKDLEDAETAGFEVR